ncbi:hypothetical protein HDU76_007059 [Blyttiomyces sp. JEL0837]|nr:hypothetical protein HDU76_007059 [Blyttiomyces sp. JEL0837]
MDLDIDAVTISLSAVIAVLGYAIATSGSDPDVHPAHLRQQSDVGRTRIRGETAILRNKITPHGTALHVNPERTIQTLYDLFWESMTKHASARFLAEKIGDAYIWKSRTEIGSEVDKVGKGLVTLVPSFSGSDSKARPVIGIMLENCVDWVVLDLACITYGLIINLSKISVLITSQKHADIILEVSGRCPALKTVVLHDADSLSSTLIQRSAALRAQWLTMKEVKAKKSDAAHVKPEAHDTATIMFRKDKDVLVGFEFTHRNIMSASTGLANHLPHLDKFGPKDTCLTFLPLSDISERAMVFSLIWAGSGIGFCEESTPKLFEEMKVFQPTILSAAPYTPEVLQFLRIVLGCQILTSFGPSCGLPYSMVTLIGDYEDGHNIGVPLTSVECKLVDVPSLNYLATDKPNPRGEICIRGHLVMKAYTNSPSVLELFDDEGWFHTGHIGVLEPKGSVTLLDRIAALS